MSIASIGALLMATMAFNAPDGSGSGSGEPAPESATDEEGDKIKLNKQDQANIGIIQQQVEGEWTKAHVLSLAHTAVIDGEYSTISEALEAGAEFVGYLDECMGDADPDTYLSSRDDKEVIYDEDDFAFLNEGDDGYEDEDEDEDPGTGA
jgi:hypothetical protein